jgi:hypothetical protein
MWIWVLFVWTIVRGALLLISSRYVLSRACCDGGKRRSSLNHSPAALSPAIQATKQTSPPTIGKEATHALFSVSTDISHMANPFTKYYDKLTEREDQEKARKFAEQGSKWATFPDAVFLKLREEEAQRLWKVAQAKKPRAHELALAQAHSKNGSSAFVNNRTAGQGVIGTSGSVNFETPKKRNRETPKKRNREEQYEPIGLVEEAESEPIDLVEEAITPTPLKRAVKRTRPKQAKTTTPAGKDVSFQSHFYNGLIQGATSMAELKGTVYEMKGFLTGRLEMVQQKSAERKFLLAQSENTIVEACVNEELMRAERDKSRLQLDESRYHEERLLVTGKMLAVSVR